MVVDGECTQHKVQVPPCWPSDFALEVRSRLGRRQDEPFRDCPKERGSPVPISLTQVCVGKMGWTAEFHHSNQLGD
eukprot:1182384-Prorocentrum_minimum.AAC.4